METLNEFLAANPAAKAEHDAIVLKAEGTARTEGETAGKITGKAEGKEEGKSEMTAVYAVAIPILSSAHYPETVKARVTEKAQAGDVEAVKDFVAIFDMSAEGVKIAAAIAEQGKETPPTGQVTDAEKTEANLAAHQKRIQDNL